MVDSDEWVYFMRKFFKYEFKQNPENEIQLERSLSFFNRRIDSSQWIRTESECKPKRMRKYIIQKIIQWISIGNGSVGFWIRVTNSDNNILPTTQLRNFSFHGKGGNFSYVPNGSIILWSISCVATFFICGLNLHISDMVQIDPIFEVFESVRHAQ